jgi:flagellar biosynthesis protein FlhG
MIGQTSRLLELNRLREKRNALADTASFVSITSGKGGTGKSFITLNLAYSLAESGYKVLALDLDFNFANLNVMIDADNDKDISDYLEHRETLQNIVYSYNDNLDFIFGYSGIENELSLSRDNIYYFKSHINSLRKKYDFILADTSAGWNGTNSAVLSISDHIIITATPEPTSVMDAYAVIKLIINEKIRGDLYLIENKCEPISAGDEAYENLSSAVTHFLNRELKFLGKVGFDNLVYHSIMNQEILLQEHSHSKISDHFNHLSNALVKVKQMANNNQL